MKHPSITQCLCSIGGLALGMGLFPLVLPAASQSDPTLLINPSNLRIAGVKGSCEQRTILVRSDQPLKDIKVVPLDLANEDGTKILPVVNLDSCPQYRETTGGNEDEALPENLKKVAIAIPLSDTQSGIFNGELLLIHAGKEKSIPITVQIKDKPHWPLIMIILGLVFSTTVSAYSVGGKIHDEITVEIEKVTANMNAAKLLPRGFRNAINKHLIRVEAERDNQQWRNARKELNLAKAIWIKWITYEPGWIALVAKMQKLVRDNDKSPRADDIKNELSNVLLNKLASYQHPKELENDLQTLIENFGLPQAKSPLSQQNGATPKIDEISRQRNLLNPLMNVLSYLKPDADGRLRMFYFGSYIILLATLTGSGFRELYLNRPGFGSDPWRDYFSLLAWGFGAEAARSSITKVIRNKEMPDVVSHPLQQQQEDIPPETPRKSAKRDSDQSLASSPAQPDFSPKTNNGESMEFNEPKSLVPKK